MRAGVAVPEAGNEPGAELDGKVDGAARGRTSGAGCLIAPSFLEERKAHALVLDCGGRNISSSVMDITFQSSAAQILKKISLS
ncbi:hypothetical protein ACFO6Q_09075 [Dokdonella ginsengisoli]|uniref:Uncharacterized protein n=1 Tax=Dokdonella ginsengisoli TaxID=363846 RepID=A0ABV9QUL8_9GAMM